MELVKCKHCGTAAYLRSAGNGKYFVHCEGALKARGFCSQLYQCPKKFNTKEEAAENWNKNNK